MNKILQTLGVAMLTLLVACHTDTQSAATSQNIKIAKPSEPIARAAGIWIDVRTPDEFQAGHLRDAMNIPVEQVAEKIAAVVPDKHTPIHVYCRSGRRSEAALQELVKLGYTNVTNQGTYQDLINKGMK